MRGERVTEKWNRKKWGVGRERGGEREIQRHREERIQRDDKREGSRGAL